MKVAEAKLDLSLDPEKYWLVRLDGCGFSKFTKSFRKPYDERIHTAMVQTANDLLTRFCAACAYTVSDEITLVFPSRRHYLDHRVGEIDDVGLEELKRASEAYTPIYRGRIQKIVSIMAGYCSARFNKHLRYGEAVAFFDARLFQLDTPDEVLENIRWRSHDGLRNSKSGLGSVYLSKSEVHGLKGAEIVEKVKQRTGVAYEELPSWYRGGYLLKKTKVVKRTQQHYPECIRRVTVGTDFLSLSGASPDLILCQNVSDILTAATFTELISETGIPQ